MPCGIFFQILLGDMSRYRVASPAMSEMFAGRRQNGDMEDRVVSIMTRILICEALAVQMAKGRLLATKPNAKKI
jgi:hypothetical protein